jgi:hypothetical protein
MKSKKVLCSCVLLTALLASCTQPGNKESVSIKLSNASDVLFSDYTFEIVLDTSAISESVLPFQVFSGKEILASQWIPAEIYPGRFAGKKLLGSGS